MIFTSGFALKACLPIAAALLATAALRHRSAALRHHVLAVGLACVVALPLLAEVLPVWRLPARADARESARSGALPTVDVATIGQSIGAPGHAAPQVLAQTSSPRVSIDALLLTTWMAGAAGSLLLLVVGLMRLRAIARRATAVVEGRLPAMVAELTRAAGVRQRVTLLLSDEPALPVTWGVRRPIVMLPRAADGWDDERTRMVLRHELAHVARGDWFAQMLGETVRALNWFNPLVWLACRRLRCESEHACDDAVLDAGVDASEYASLLLELARTFSSRHALRSAPAMARPSTLEGRINAMLNTRRPRRPLTRAARAATVVLFVAATAIVAAAGQRFSSFSGTLVDQTNAVLPNAAVTLTNAATGSKYEVHTDRTGHFQFVGLPDGDYAVSTSEPGFAPLKDAVAIAGRDVERNVQLHVGSLQETIRVVGGPSSFAPPNLERRAHYRQIADDQRRQIMERCAADGPGPVGGNIKQPSKLVDVKPKYPERLSTAKVGGVVVLEAVIGTDGLVNDVRVESSADPELDAAAIEAVRQWEFSTTFLNCTPIEVTMRVSAMFAPQ